jgi:uncharacterized protein YndB with AHSA1/START domain
MTALARVEFQAEVGRRREEVFGLVSTRVGLRRWIDAAELEPSVGGAFRFQLRDAVAIGRVLALDDPQHISLAWDWEGEPLGGPSVVAFDLIDHVKRTHLTLRHVGLQPGQQVRLHEEMWRYWFGRLVSAAEAGGTQPEQRVTGDGGTQPE